MMPRRISGAALDGELGSDYRCESELILERGMVHAFGFQKRGEIAHAAGQLLLPDGAEILDDRALHHRLLTGLQHACDRYRHAPQGMKLRDQAAEALGAAQIGFRPQRADKLRQDVERIKEPFRSTALVCELAGRLFPGAIDLTQHVIVGHERIGEHHLVETGLSGHLIDRVYRDTRCFHVDQELRQSVAAVFFGRRRGAKQSKHVVCDLRAGGPDLAAVNAPAAVDLRCLGLGREQVGARARLAHADRETQVAAADTRQNIYLDVFGSVFEQNRTALPISDEVQVRRCVGDAELLGHHVTLQLAAFPSAILLRPSHADPAFGADAPAEGAVVRIPLPRMMRIKCPGRDFFREERPYFGAQCLAFGRQTDRIEGQTDRHREATKGQNSPAPRRATCLPSSAAQ